MQVVAFSGGKDSTAMALWLLRESGLPNPMRFAFCDTGNEHPITMAHLDYLETALGVTIERIKPPLDFLGLAQKKQRFPSTMTRFCTEELKIRPLAKWLEAQAFTVEPVICQGIRWDESVNRRKMAEWDRNNNGRLNLYDCDLWRPIIAWTAEQVFACHAAHGVEPNPLYRMGAKRVGCRPCIMVNFSELRSAFHRDPDLLPKLIAWEAAVAAKSKHGASRFFSTNVIPAYAHDRDGVAVDGTTYTYASAQAVHDYVMKTATLDLFDRSDVPSCMSGYGLCE